MSPICCWRARSADRVSLRYASRSERPAGGLSGSCWSRAACSRWPPARWASASPSSGVWLFANAVAGITFPYYIQWTIDGRVGLFVAAVCLGTALLVGLLPAVQVSKLAASRSLKEGERTATSGVGRRRLTTALLTVELALTLVLLAGAGLMMRSFLAVYRADSVVDATRVVTMPLSLPSREVPHARAAHRGLPATGGAGRRDSWRLFDRVRQCRPLRGWTVSAAVGRRTAAACLANRSRSSRT